MPAGERALAGGSSRCYGHLMASDSVDLTGIWLCEYEYESAGHGKFPRMMHLARSRAAGAPGRPLPLPEDA